MIRHEATYPFYEEASKDDVILDSDTRAPDGLRVARLRHECSRLVAMPVDAIDPEAPALPPGDLVERQFEVYCSIVFDKTGKLISIHADHPWDV